MISHPPHNQSPSSTGASNEARRSSTNRRDKPVKSRSNRETLTNIKVAKPRLRIKHFGEEKSTVFDRATEGNERDIGRLAQESDERRKHMKCRSNTNPEKRLRKRAGEVNTIEAITLWRQKLAKPVIANNRFPESEPDGRDFVPD
ncbi:hypothetical protein Bca4012_007856 [Brassica carinata]|uniref:Uncharacterized protein n=1 Tax=Brassica carinata TaxID=52824 RepID=A0A8X7RS28_BRACI|nr:hypothetical protein Bca52824_038549 [Brassica carinata]